MEWVLIGCCSRIQEFQQRDNFVFQGWFKAGATPKKFNGCHIKYCYVILKGYCVSQNNLFSFYVDCNSYKCVQQSFTCQEANSSQ